MDGAYVIECDDVLDRRVAMSRDLWVAHVLFKRPWMDGWEAVVEQVLTKPDRINFDKSFSDRECFYRTGTPLNPTTMLKVIVEFDLEGRGTVITAFPTHLVSRRERQKWP